MTLQIGGSTAVDLSQYVKRTELADYARAVDLADYAKRAELGAYATNDALSTGLAGKPSLASVFGAAGRSAAPVCEVRCTTPYTNAANTDARAEGGWTAVSDADAMATITDAAGGFSRIVLPIPGRWEAKFWARSAASSGSAACKLLLNGSTVLTDAVASDLKPAGGEGTPLLAEFCEVCAAGDVLRWATWSSVASTFAPNSGNFSKIRTRIVVRWLGPR